MSDGRGWSSMSLKASSIESLARCASSGGLRVIEVGESWVQNRAHIKAKRMRSKRCLPPRGMLTSIWK